MVNDSSGLSSLTTSEDASASVTLNGAHITATGNLDTSAAASSTVTSTGLGGFGAQFALIDSDVTALVSIQGASTIDVGGNLTLASTATKNVSATANATASSVSADAAVAIVTGDSTADAHISGATLLKAGGDIGIGATNTVVASALADGTTADGGGGASVAFVGGDSKTSAYLDQSSGVTAHGLAISAATDNTFKATAKSTSGGAADNGTTGDTESEKVLGPKSASNPKGQDAKTSDGAVSLAGAVAVSNLNSDTQAFLSKSTTC